MSQSAVASTCPHCWKAILMCSKPFRSYAFRSTCYVTRNSLFVCFKEPNTVSRCDRNASSISRLSNFHRSDFIFCVAFLSSIFAFLFCSMCFYALVFTTNLIKETLVYYYVVRWRRKTEKWKGNWRTNEQKKRTHIILHYHFICEIAESLSSFDR